MSLVKITTDLGVAYKKWKSGEKEKDKAKELLWKEINALAEAEPEEKLITVEGLADEDTIENYVEREHPAWRIDEWRKDDDGTYEVILLLRPELKDFTFVNAEDGMVYRRQFNNGSPTLDDDLLRRQDPDLWVRISDIPQYDDIAELVFEAGVDHREIDEWIQKHWKGPRTLKSLDSLDDDTLAEVQPYIHPGKPTVSLPAPRKAKPEELEEVEDVS